MRWRQEQVLLFHSFLIISSDTELILLHFNASDEFYNEGKRDKRRKKRSEY